MPQSKASRQRVLAAERRARALELRKAGVTYKVIAEEVGYADASGARKAILTALSELVPEETLRDVRKLELERIDRMFFAHYNNAIGGDIRATETCLKLQERRARILGLDAPKQVEVITIDALDEEIQRLSDGMTRRGLDRPKTNGSTSGNGSKPKRGRKKSK